MAPQYYDYMRLSSLSFAISRASHVRLGVSLRCDKGGGTVVTLRERLMFLVRKSTFL